MKIRKSFLLLVAVFILALNSVYAQNDDTEFVVGYTSFFGLDVFTQEMASLGYVDGDNILYMTFDYTAYSEDMSPEESLAVYQSQLQMMVDAEVDLFITNTDSDAISLQKLTSDIPIIFTVSDDPVATGAVESLLEPGRNATGIITNRPHERRLQILTEITPVDTIYYLYSPLSLEGEVVLEQVQALGADLGVEVIPALTPDGPTGLTALENMPGEVDWLFLTPSVPYFDVAFNEALISTSIEHSIGMAWIISDPSPGYVISYGPDITDNVIQSAYIADRILRGASPSDLPVEIAENYLTVNLEAAEAIGLDIPASLLRQANLIVRPGYFDNLEMSFGG